MELNDIQQMDDLNGLEVLKQKLKDQVVDGTLSWQQRIFLYTQIKIINERILQLKNLRQITT